MKRKQTAADKQQDRRNTNRWAQQPQTFRLVRTKVVDGKDVACYRLGDVLQESRIKEKF